MSELHAGWLVHRFSGDGEPRVSHVEVSRALGYQHPRVFLKLLRDNKKILSRFGVLHSESRKSGAAGGRPSETYFLNRKQVLWLCTKSEQPFADAVTTQMVHVFEAALSGAALPVGLRAALVRFFPTIVEASRSHLRISGAPAPPPPPPPPPAP